MYPFRFMAKCQDKDIATQYMVYNVRLFDLRIKFDDDGKPVVAHGMMKYAIDEEKLFSDLSYLDSKGDCMIRLLHEVRTKKESEDEKEKERFRNFCDSLLNLFPNLKFCNGRNLYTYTEDYCFGKEPDILELYSSVCPPKYIDDWFPRLYALLNNKRIKKEVVLMIEK
jgi:hypothetical protein